MSRTILGRTEVTAIGGETVDILVAGKSSRDEDFRPNEPELLMISVSDDEGSRNTLRLSPAAARAILPLVQKVAADEDMEGNEEFIDGDGYPTDEALDRISTFTGTAEEMTDYVQSLMHSGRAEMEDFVDDFGRPGKRLTLVTGGWSGCESVISALQGTMFHLMGWESSFRGGRHTYTFTPQQWEMSFRWGNP